MRTSRKASARFGHSQYAEEAQTSSRRQGSSRAASARGRAASSSRSRSSRTTLGARMERTRTQSRKRKASRQFDRSGYGRTRDASTSSTRAALHTGSLGSRQRHASRAYAQGSPFGNAAKSAVGGFFSFLAEAVGGFFAKGRSLRFYVLGGFALCMVLTVVFLYPSVQNYYLAVRDQAQSQAEYEALQDYYERLQSDVASLQTDEGVKTRAHDKYGWVSPGENSVMVQGVQASSGIDDEIGIVPVGSIKAPETWYSGVLDPLFGYEG